MNVQLVLRYDSEEVVLDIPASSLKDQLQGRHKYYLNGVDLHCEVTTKLISELEEELGRLAEKIQTSRNPSETAIYILCASMVLALNRKYNHGQLDGQGKSG
jgi:hypothetical protein